MADNTPIQDFLEAEDKARELLDELVRLKESVQSYRNAGQALNQAAAAIEDLAGRLQSLVGGIGDILEALRSIGTPELLQRLDGVVQLMAQRFHELEAECESAKREISQRQEETTRLMAQRFDETRAEYGVLRRTTEIIESHLVRLTKISHVTLFLNVVLVVLLVISLLLRAS